MKRAISIFLSTLLISSGASIQVSADTPAATGSGEKVTYIVTLSEPSLIDVLNSSDGSFGSIRELVSSPQGKAAYNRVIAQQDSVRKRIEALLPSADLSSCRSYTAITNGISFEGSASDRKKLEGLCGVLSVSISGSSQLSAYRPGVEDDGTDDELPYFGDAYKATMNTREAYDMGYTGKGILIAVLDSEFDVSHEAFSVVPPEMKYDKDYVKLIDWQTPLNIDKKYSADQLFYNGKIIYAYDYGENDTDCADPDHYHGTHVTCIAAGNSGPESAYNYRGVAYDAQLALLKISDSNGMLMDSYIISALDDALKLGPDVINCSFGARKYLMYDCEGRQYYEKLNNAGISVFASAGNGSFNGSATGYDEIPAYYTQYGTGNTPGSDECVFSVAACYPEYKYEEPVSFIFNDSEVLDATRLPLYIEGIEELSMNTERKLSVRKPLEDDEEDEDEDEDSAYSYVYLDADGSEATYSGKDLKGKYLILNRSDLPLEEVLKASILHGCLGLALIDNGEPTEGVYDGSDNTQVFLLDSKIKEYLLQHPKGKLDIETSDTPVLKENEYAFKPAWFTSYGMRSDLVLGPDITAPGDNILSAGYDDSYNYLSGTSMSSPCETGVYALLKQYFNESDIAEELTTYELQSLIHKLLMSTAVPAVYDEGSSGPLTYYSPRLQGSGITDTAAAIRTRAYLSVNGEKPKASMKASEDGTYTFDFTVTNYSDLPVDYELGAAIQTDSYEYKTEKNSKKKSYINTLVPRSLINDSDISFTVNGAEVTSVTVDGDSELTVSVNISIHPELLEEYNSVFTNGFYVDGYVFLDPEDDVTLSLPFSGFCGDWSASPVFQAENYDENRDFPKLWDSLAAGQVINNKMVYLELGKNILGYKELPTELSFSTTCIRDYLLSNPDLPTDMLLPNLHIMRDTLDYTITIQDTGSNTLYHQNFNSIPSNFSYDYQPAEEFADTVFRERVNELTEFCSTLFESRYKYTVSASTVGEDGNAERTETRTIDFRVDNTAPEVITADLEKKEDGRVYLTLTAFDEGLLQGIELFALSWDDDGHYEKQISVLSDLMLYDPKHSFCSYEFDPETHYYTFVFDVTDYGEYIRKMQSAKPEIYSDDNVIIEFTPDDSFEDVSDLVIGYRALDCAFNHSPLRTINTTHYGSMELTFKNQWDKPIPDVIVSIDGEDYITDENGRIILSDLPLGVKVISIKDDCYEFYDASKVMLLSLTPEEHSVTEDYIIQPVTRPSEPEDSKPDDKKPDESSHDDKKPDENSTPSHEPDKTNKTGAGTKTDNVHTVVFPDTGSSDSMIIIVFSLTAAGCAVYLTLLSVRRKKKQ